MPSSNNFKQQLDRLDNSQLRKLYDRIITRDSKHEEWEFDPAEPLQFINSRDYCNLQRQCATVIKREFCKIFEGEPLHWDHNLVIVVGAIGLGKSYLLSLIMAYIAHCLLCLRDPPSYFTDRGHEISPGSKLSIINASISKENAKKVVFSEVQNKIVNNPWFMRNYPPNDRVTSELIFDAVPRTNKLRLIDLENGTIRKNICITPGGSSMGSMVGYSVFCGIMDEATLFQSRRGDDLADLVYSAMDRRIYSRFGSSMGMRVIAGSPLYIGDFLERKEAEVTNVESKNIHPHVVRRPIWDRKHPLWFANRKPVFHANVETAELVQYPETYEPPNKKWIKIPMEYWDVFNSNPEGSLRDLAARPSAAIVRFFENIKIVGNLVNENRSDPIIFNKEERKYELAEWFKPKDPDRWYVIHFDMALGGKQFRRVDAVEVGTTRDRQHDACGFAMGHVKEYVKRRVDDKNDTDKPVIKIDIMHCLKGQKARSGPGGDFERGAIRMEELLGWVDAIARRGFKIAVVTVDGFQSAFFMQALEDRFYESRYCSVDRATGPYIDFKETLLDGRLDYYYHEQFIKEAQRLEKIAGKKIDHAPGSSKDITDSVAGVIDGLLKIEGLNVGQEVSVTVY